MAAQFIFTMNRVGKVIPPNRHILRNISLSFYPGAKIGVLGLNGAGKSTLLKIMAGIDKDIEGEAEPMKGIKIGYLPQEPVFDPEKTVRETVDESFSKLHEAEDALNKIYDRYAEPDADFDALAKEQARLEAIIQAAGGSDVGTQLEIAAEALRLPPWDQQIKSLSGGERRRVAICRLLLEKPDMLLLDEPTNHLDAESIAWLERYLHEYEGTVVAVTHDRYFLDNAAGWILELDRGEGIPGRATTQAGSSRRSSASQSRTPSRPPSRSRWTRSLSGSGRTPRAATQSPRPASSASRSCRAWSSRSATRPTSSSFRPDRVSATRSLR